jgi:hypothetical protein
MTFLRRLARICIRPRTTIREILDDPQHRRILPLLLLATLSAVFGNVNDNMRGSLKSVPYATPMILFATLLSAFVMILLFYFFAWLAYLAGKFLEGQGSHADVRTALAWGLAPVIWALAYRVPAAFLGWTRSSARLDAPNENFSIHMNEFSGGCLAALVVGLLELTMFVWYVVVSSRAVGEAHRFSSWRGFGSLAIVALAPIVIGISALLAFNN